MNNKSLAYEQSRFQQACYALRSTRSYPSALKTYIQYVKHSQRAGGREGSRIHALVGQTDDVLNPYARLFMIIWALAMLAAVGLQSGKVDDLMPTKRAEQMSVSSPLATSAGRLAYPHTRQNERALGIAKQVYATERMNF